jgi:hypothetical protein
MTDRFALGVFICFLAGIAMLDGRPVLAVILVLLAIGANT